MGKYDNENEYDENLEWDLPEADLDDEEAAAWEDGTLALLGGRERVEEPVEEDVYEGHAEEPIEDTVYEEPEEEYPYRDSVDDEMVEDYVPEEEEPEEDEIPEEIEISEESTQEQERPAEEQLATGIILLNEDDIPQGEFSDETVSQEVPVGEIEEVSEEEVSDEASQGTAEEEQPRRRFGLLDAGIILAGAAAVILAITAVFQYQEIHAVQEEAARYASLGSSLSGIGTIGEDRIEAIAENRIARDAQRVAIEEIVAEKVALAENEGTDPVTMTLTTIQSDLKVKFRSEGGYLISNVPFQVSVQSPAGKTQEYTDDDEDGVIHITSLTSGTYKVTMLPLVTDAGNGTDITETDAYKNYSQYKIPTDTQSVEVTDKIAYTAVDVSDEIKSASEVNVAAEDTQHKMATESAVQDTVEWVASSATTTTTTTTAATTESTEAATTGATDAAAEASTAVTEASTASTEGATEAAEAAGTEGSEGAETASTEIPGEATEVTDGATSESAGEASTGMPTEAVEITTTHYTGWQNIGGKTYYYNANGEPVTGNQIINGASYTFDDSGVLQSGTSKVGIDVSQWNGSINWSQVANSGVSYAIIRCGYRGSSSGALIRDPNFSTNIAGASAAGLKVGIYVFSQAINEVEAVEEASMAIELAAGYNVRLPIFIDIEAAGGRADSISVSERTAVVSAFCQTVQAAGYSAGIYSNTNWFTEKVNTPALTSYHIWVAQYASTLSYSRTRYDIWQYSSKGHVAGISGDVDMNMAYRSY